MRNYSFLERMIAKTLDSTPRLKFLGKNFYQRINFMIFREKGFEYYIHPDAKILSPYEWITIGSEKEDSIFFGYYDKSPWSIDGNKLLLHRYKNDDVLEIIVFDKVNCRLKEVAVTKAWNYQQGSMLQWLDNKTIIFNDFVDQNLVSRIVDIETSKEKLIDYPIQSVDPIGKEALTLNYKRLFKLRKQYGYKVNSMNYNEDFSLSEDGLWKIDLQNNKANLIISLEDLISSNYREEMKDSEHKINHIIYSPNKTKFLFMHRWLSPSGKYSRLYVADKDGSNITMLFDDRMVSHYSWKDDNTIIAWARTKNKGDQYYVVELNTMKYYILGENQLNVFGDGHPTFSPDGKWIITDTYPNRARQRYLLLYNVIDKELLVLGKFYAPFKYNWDNRVDLHPRWDRSGRMISIDSCHEGFRKSYIIDVTSIVKR